MSTEFTMLVTADLPEVTETPIRVEVRCGETTAYVCEYGHQGSGHWAAWTSIGGSVINGGTIGYSFEQALSDARDYVYRQERSRLMHTQLREILEERR